MPDDFFVLIAESEYGDTVYTVRRDEQRDAEGQESCWRVTTWRMCGPTGHSYYRLREWARELRWARATMNASDGRLAGEVLDAWSETPDWERGLKQCVVMHAVNTWHWQGNKKLAGAIYRLTLDEVYQALPEYWRQHREWVKVSGEAINV